MIDSSAILIGLTAPCEGKLLCNMFAPYAASLGLLALFCWRRRRKAATC